MRPISSLLSSSRSGSKAVGLPFLVYLRFIQKEVVGNRLTKERLDFAYHFAFPPATRSFCPYATARRKDIIVLMRDTGMRNVRELYRVRVEHIDFNNRVIFNPSSKTLKGRRFVPLSERALDILKARCNGRTEGWVFKSRYKGKHIGATFVNRQWVKARKAAGLHEDLVLYCARHDFGRMSCARQAISRL